MNHEEGYSLSDALIPLGLILVLSASAVIAAEHPLSELMPSTNAVKQNLVQELNLVAPELAEPDNTIKTPAIPVP